MSRGVEKPGLKAVEKMSDKIYYVNFYSKLDITSHVAT